MMKKILILISLLLAACDKSAPTAEQPRWLPQWKETESLSVYRAGAAVVATGGYIYAMGGVDGRIFLRTVEYAPILPDGKLGPWRATSILPEARGFTDAVAYQGHIYLVGGGKGKHGKELLTSSVRAQINEDGSLGPWQALEEQMQVPRRCSKVCEYQGSLITLGGFGGVLLDSVETAALSAQELRPWRLNRHILTMPRYVNSMKRVGDYLYVLGGHHQSKGIGLNQVEYAYLPDLIKDNVDVWQRASDMQQGRYGLGSAYFSGHLLALGGISGLEYLDSIEVAAIQADGSLAPWQTQDIRLPQPMANFAATRHGEYLYLLGGTTLGGYLNQVYVAQFDDSRRLGNWFSANEKAAVQAYDKPQAVALLRGQVVQVAYTEQYSYLQLRGENGLYWLAGPLVEVEAGDYVEHSSGVLMSGYFSDSLQRSFDKILFVGQIKRIN